MKRFKHRQRIVVSRGALEGAIGTVSRLRKSDDGAWVAIDMTPTVAHHGGCSDLFPFNSNGDDRYNHTLLYPEDCEEEQP